MEGRCGSIGKEAEVCEFVLVVISRFVLIEAVGLIISAELVFVGEKAVAVHVNTRNGSFVKGYLSYAACYSAKTYRPVALSR